MHAEYSKRYFFCVKNDIKMNMENDVGYSLYQVIKKECVRFEVFTEVTMKNGICWDVMPCGFCQFLQEPHSVTSQKTPFFRKECIWKVCKTCARRL
jgi:hypothetical protein